MSGDLKWLLMFFAGLAMFVAFMHYVDKHPSCEAMARDVSISCQENNRFECNTQAKELLEACLKRHD